MKIKILSTLFLTLTITGCQKQPEDTKTSKVADPVVKAQFEKSDAIINKYLDQLESPNTTIEDKTRILCKDYPTEYKENYMPALLKLSPTDYTETKLLKELDIALNYYKEKNNVHC